MEATNEKTPRQYTEEAFWTGHFHYLMQALAIAMNKCLVWRLAVNGDPFTLDDLFQFAKEQDERHPLEKNAFYMVSREGAIGLAPGVEYLVKWMFIPMERCPERDRLLRQLHQIITQQKEEELKAQMPPVPDTPVESKPSLTTPLPTNDPPTDAKSPRFCTYCGNKLQPGYRFCSRCGNPIRQITHPSAPQ